MEIKVKVLDTIVDTAKEFLQTLITPTLKEVGLLSAESVRSYRFKNQVNILLKAEELLQKKGIKTRKPSLKLLVPLLEEVSIEDDESLQDKWAILLANIVREDSQINTSLYSFILSQMSKDDAEILEIIFDYCTLKDSEAKDLLTISNFILRHRVLHIQTFEKEYKNANLVVDNLIRLRLIKEIHDADSIDIEFLTITKLGIDFFIACNRM